MADTCYCMSVMQHHKAPTRLLDWTYSPYVAARFAFNKRENGENGVVWCLNTNWLRRAAGDIVGEWALARWNDERSEAWFHQLFMSQAAPEQFVFSANPFHLTERLKIQQGLFLCQGDVSIPFEDNLSRMNGYPENVRRVELVLDNNEALTQFAETLWRMNISSASLFPGLDGYAESLGEHPAMLSETGDTGY